MIIQAMENLIKWVHHKNKGEKNDERTNQKTEPYPRKLQPGQTGDFEHGGKTLR